MSNDKSVERDGTDFPLTPKWDESMNFTKDDLSAAREALSAMLAEMADPAFCPDDGGCIFGWDHDDCLRELCMGCVRELATRAHAIEATLAQRDETVQSLRVQLAQRDAEVARLRRRYDETVRSLNVFNGALTNSNLMLRAQLDHRDAEVARLRGEIEWLGCQICDAAADEEHANACPLSYISAILDAGGDDD